MVLRRNDEPEPSSSKPENEGSCQDTVCCSTRVPSVPNPPCAEVTSVKKI